jgi:2-hydroxyacyl-CoA lyase 1
MVSRGPSIDARQPGLTAAGLEAFQRRLRGDVADGHALVARSLRDLGITHVFGISGTPVELTLGAVARLGLRVIGVRHQQAAVLAAAAQNFLAGRLTAVAMVSAGPAVTNTATGVLVARDNGWPVVVLGGRRPLNMVGRGSFQDLDGAELLRPLARGSAVVADAADIPAAVERAVRLASAAPRGPVYLDLPEDVLGGVGRAESAPAFLRSDVTGSDPAGVRAAADLLLAGRRPLVLFGPAVRWGDAFVDLHRLVEQLGAPFVAAPMARGLLPDDHPLSFTAVAGAVQRGTDVVLVVGARLDWTFRFGSELGLDVSLVQIDDDPAAMGLNRVATVGLVGPIGRTLAALSDQLSRGTREIGTETARRAWLEELAGLRQRREQVIVARTAAASSPMSPHRLMAELRDFLPPDAVCVLDGNVSMAAAQQVIRRTAALSLLTAGANGCMGVGVPFGIGAKLAFPDRPVVVVSGDFAFGLTGMEMETAVRHRIPLVVVVANNDGPSGALKQREFYATACAERVAMFQPGIRYDRIVEALGGHGEHVEEPGELRGALERAFASGVAGCVNVRIDPYAPHPGR